MLVLEWKWSRFYDFWEIKSSPFSRGSSIIFEQNSVALPRFPIRNCRTLTNCWHTLKNSKINKLTNSFTVLEITTSVENFCSVCWKEEYYHMRPSTVNTYFTRGSKEKDHQTISWWNTRTSGMEVRTSHWREVFCFGRMTFLLNRTVFYGLRGYQPSWNWLGVCLGSLCYYELCICFFNLMKL